MFGNKEKDRMEPVSGPAPAPSMPHTPVPGPVPSNERTERTERTERNERPERTDRHDKSGHTILAEGSSFNGTLKVQGSLTINGSFEGSVVCTENLLIGKTGHVKAELEARNTTVAGRVEGSIKAHERVELQGGSSLLGDVHARSFVIQDECHYQGRCIMGKDAGASDSTSSTKSGPSGMGLVKQA